MINFELKKSSNEVHYDLTFTKLVHKRSGELAEEPGDTCYGIPLSKVKLYITTVETQNRFGDKNVTLEEYIKEFNKAYKEVCKLLKKTL